MANLARSEPRQERRKNFSNQTRIALLEDDADQHEWLMHRIEKSSQKTQQMMLGVMVTAASATIVGAINLVIGKVGA